MGDDVVATVVGVGIGVGESARRDSEVDERGDEKGEDEERWCPKAVDEEREEAVEELSVASATVLLALTRFLVVRGKPKAEPRIPVAAVIVVDFFFQRWSPCVSWGRATATLCGTNGPLGVGT